MTEEERQLSDLMRLRHAVKAMSKSVHKALLTGTYEGAGDMMVKNYQRLHAKAVEMFPQDFFIETLMLETDNQVDDHGKLAQVQLITEQLASYVDGLIRELSPNNFSDVEDLKTLGGNLRDQIIRMTKSTLRNALINIDIGDIPEPPHPPQPPHAPFPPNFPFGSQPPHPHAPHQPPQPGQRRKIKINIEDNEQDFASDFGADFDGDENPDKDTFHL